MRVEGAIDCDIHPVVPGMHALLPYMEESWREQFLSRGIDGLDLNSHSIDIPSMCRPDWRPAHGRPAGDLAIVRRELLDRFQCRAAICNVLYGVEGSPNEYLAAVLARAVNDWVRFEWLDGDARLRASIVVAAQNPELAVEEIERRAGDHRFVQVLLLASGEIPLGRRFFWPIYAAAQRHGLPIGIHAGSTYHHPPTAAGWPSFFLEESATSFVAFEAQLLSLITQGVFKQFPDLRVVLLESGFGWVAPFLWGADTRWRAMRTEVPWVDASPTELVRRHVRFTIRPFDAPPRAEQVARVMEQLGSDELLLFATDYPHDHFSGDEAVPDSVPAALLDRILTTNALATYPRLTEAVHAG